MAYVDINDVCNGFKTFTKRILNNEIEKGEDGLAYITNLCWPKAITILDLATIVKDSIIKLSEGKIRPKVVIVDNGLPSQYGAEDNKFIVFNIEKAKRLLNIEKLTSPEESIERIVVRRIVQKQHES